LLSDERFFKWPLVVSRDSHKILRNALANQPIVGNLNLGGMPNVKNLF